jgi:hypothetical protein
MKHILFISSLFITLNCSAQKYIIGTDFNTLRTHDYTFTKVDTYQLQTGSTFTSQKQRLIVPLICFNIIDKKSRLYGIEIGYGKFYSSGKTSSLNDNDGNTYKSGGFDNTDNYQGNLHFGKITTLNKFKLVTTVMLPISFFPKSQQESFDTAFKTSSKEVVSYRISSRQQANHLTTGVRLKAEANYPVYKKINVAVKLNFGIDYDLYFGKSIDQSETYNGTTLQKHFSEFEYKDRIGFQKHFSPSIGFNYFL